MHDAYQYLRAALPADHCQQLRATDMLVEHFKDIPPPSTLLDFGCGAGNSIDFFRSALPKTKWIGVDIETSPEVVGREREDGEFHSYNGTDLPFEEGVFPLIYSNQVLEHVRFPEKVLSEIARVMTDDGVFIGQVSQLEPFHSYSIFNFTIYGFKRVCESNGLEVILFRPGIDGITLIERSVKERPVSMNQWFASESPLNEEIERTSLKEKQSIQVINFRKLLHCGQFGFICRKLKRETHASSSPADE